MHLKKLKIGNTGKRVVLVDMKFIHGTDDCPITEQYFLVGELPIEHDDANINLEFDLHGTLKFEYEEDAINTYKSYGEQ